MFTYFLNRWVIARRFHKAKVGYVYRRRSDLPGFVVTEDDRKAVLNEFRQRYWKHWILMWVGFLLCAALIVFFAYVLNLSESFLTFSTYALANGLVAFVVWEQRQWMLLPERAFAGRPQLDPEVPTSGWLGRFQRLSRERSWIKHAIFISICGSVAWLLAPRSMDAEVGQWFLFGCFAASLILLFYGALHKALGTSES